MLSIVTNIDQEVVQNNNRSNWHLDSLESPSVASASCDSLAVFQSLTHPEKLVLFTTDGGLSRQVVSSLKTVIRTFVNL